MDCTEYSLCLRLAHEASAGAAERVLSAVCLLIL
jgi:hypothetical protein